MITVLLSVYNGEKWLVQCIESVLEQTYSNFEFLIIDDGSEDKSLEIIKNYSNLDKRIKFISQENIGLTKSLNKGINLAKGEWIARIDADDVALPERLELQINYANKNDLNLVGCQSNIIDSKGNIKYKIRIPIDYKNLYINLKKQKSFFSHSSVLFKKNLVISLGGYRETMKRSQDYDLWLRISEVSKIGALDYVGVLVREHDSRISNQSSGLDQRLHAHYANISYILRTSYPKFTDPLDSKNNFEINRFKEFVYQYLIKTDTIDFYKKLYLFNKKTKKDFLIFRFTKIPFYFKSLKYIKKLLIWKIRGDFISKDAALCWVKLSTKGG